MPRPCPPEFRQRALDLVRWGRPVPGVAGLPGFAESCSYRWRKQDAVDRGLEPGTSGTESAELVAARQEIRDLEEENKILLQGRRRGRGGGAPERPVPPRGGAPR